MGVIEGCLYRGGCAQAPACGRTMAATPTPRRVAARGFALAVIAALLGGCAGTASDVRTWAAPTFAVSASDARTYVPAANPLGGGSDTGDTRDADAAVAASVERALAAYGFVAAPEAAAHYRLTLSADSRPERVSVADATCVREGHCYAAPPAPLHWPGRKYYRHSLTLRFFDRASGQEVYKASASLVDSQPALRPAVPGLVASALARLPFPAADSARWRVTLREPSAGSGRPQAVEILAVPESPAGG